MVLICLVTFFFFNCDYFALAVALDRNSHNAQLTQSFSGCDSQQFAISIVCQPGDRGTELRYPQVIRRQGPRHVFRKPVQAPVRPEPGGRAEEHQHVGRGKEQRKYTKAHASG
jgi:hypothetical protein